MTVTFGRIGLIGALAAGLLLAGCGRKGYLEPPPSASVAGDASAPAQPALGEPEHSALESERREAGSRPSVRKKSFFLDFLLDGDDKRARRGPYDADRR